MLPLPWLFCSIFTAHNSPLFIVSQLFLHGTFCFSNVSNHQTSWAAVKHSRASENKFNNIHLTYKHKMADECGGQTLCFRSNKCKETWRTRTIKSGSYCVWSSPSQKHSLLLKLEPFWLFYVSVFYFSVYLHALLHLLERGDFTYV